jgi:gamma-glutamyltranspeptidase/glutathione hydrolase
LKNNLIYEAFIYTVFIGLISFTGGKNETKSSLSKTNKRGLFTKKAMVVSARRQASKIGSEPLKQGRIAFDAMFVTEMAITVVYPFAGNHGGGGFMAYRVNSL